MDIHTDAVIDFADQAIYTAGKMSPNQQRQLISLAHGRRMPLTDTPWEERLEAGIEKAFTDRRFVALATIAISTNTQVQLEGLIAGEWPSNMNFLFDIAHYLANPTRTALDDVVSTVSADGWSTFKIGEDVEIIPPRVVGEIVRQCDAFAELNPTWAEEAEAAFDENLTMHREMAQNLRSMIANVDTFLGQLGASEGGDIIMPGEVERPAPIAEAYAPERYETRSDNRAPTSSGERLAFVSAKDLLGRPLKPRQLVFGNMIEKGVVTLLSAQPGAGKSTLTMQIACAVASGKDFAGFKVSRPEVVVCVAAEESRDEIMRRVAAITEHMRLDDEALDRLKILDREGPLLMMDKASGKAMVTKEAEMLEHLIIENGAGMVMFDPFVHTHDLDESSNSEMAAMISSIQAMGRRTNTAILMVHHLAKNTKAENLDSNRGATAIGAAVRSACTLRQDVGSDTVILQCVKSNNHAKADQTAVFQRSSVTLSTGDKVGILVPSIEAPSTAATPKRR